LFIKNFSISQRKLAQRFVVTERYAAQECIDSLRANARAA
jgi:hypothetical protein